MDVAAATLLRFVNAVACCVVLVYYWRPVCFAQARAKALPTDMDNWDSGLKLKGLHFKGFDKPPTLVCYLCGREFGTFSVKIHHDTCKKKYLRRMESLPRRDRKVCAFGFVQSICETFC